MSSLHTNSGDEISLAEVATRLQSASKFLWAERTMIARRMVLAGIFGVIIAFGSPVEYSASMRLLPYRGGGGAGAGLSGLAGLAGVRLPAGASDVTITADLYPEVVKSLDFRIAVAETPLRFSKLNRQLSAIEFFRDVRKPAATEVISSYSIGLPGRVLSFFNNAETETKVGQSTSSDSTTIRQYDPAFLSLVETLGSRLTISTDAKTRIILVSAKMPDPYAAADLVRVSADRLMLRITEYESQKAADNFRFINEQYQQAKVRYERIQLELAAFSDRNRSLVSATAQINRDRIQREYDIAFELYQQFSREMEQARIKMNQDTPLFMVLDQVTVPNAKTSPNRLRIVMLMLMLGIIVGVTQLGIRNLPRSSSITSAFERSELPPPAQS